MNERRGRGVCGRRERGERERERGGGRGKRERRAARCTDRNNTKTISIPLDACWRLSDDQRREQEDT